MQGTMYTAPGVSNEAAESRWSGIRMVFIQFPIAATIATMLLAIPPHAPLVPSLLNSPNNLLPTDHI